MIANGKCRRENVKKTTDNNKSMSNNIQYSIPEGYKTLRFCVRRQDQCSKATLILIVGGPVSDDAEPTAT